VRQADYQKCFFATFKKSPNQLNSPKTVSSESDFDSFLKDSELKTFRGINLVSIDTEHMRYHGKAYRDYQEIQKTYIGDPSYPTHKDFPYGLARWIPIGRPYGDTYLIDCTKVTKPMLDKISQNPPPSSVVLTLKMTHGLFTLSLVSKQNRLASTKICHLTKKPLIVKTTY